MIYYIDLDNKIHKTENKELCDFNNFKYFNNLKDAKKKRRAMRKEQRIGWRKIKRERKVSKII